MTRLITPALYRSSRLGALSLSVLLASCANFQAIAPATQAIDKVNITMPADVRQSNDAWPAAEWWTSYADPQLNQLVERALAKSPNLAAAQARIARAQSAVNLSQTATAPQVNGSVDMSYGRQSENYLVPRPPLGTGGEYVSQGQAAVSFGLDLDLWGKNAALIRAAEAQLKGAVYDREAARLALTTSVVRAYTQLAAQYDMQDVLSATLEQRRSIRRLIDQRVKNGLDTQVEVRQAETNEAGLRIEIEQLATSIKVTRLQLAALTGEMPAAAESIARPTMSFGPFKLPKTLPLDLLGRRPELAAQRARIEAAYGEADVAKAQFYPNISLNGLIGFQAIGLGNLLSAGSLMNSVGPAIHLPIFDAGRLRANYAGKASDIDAAIAQYNQSVLGAAQDVAEQLTRVSDLDREETVTREALAAAEEAHRLATLRYKGGLSPYLTVLTVESQLLAQRRAMANLKARREELNIALVRSLGGGFTVPAAASQASLQQK